MSWTLRVFGVLGSRALGVSLVGVLGSQISRSAEFRAFGGFKGLGV